MRRLHRTRVRRRVLVVTVLAVAVLAVAVLGAVWAGIASNSPGSGVRMAKSVKITTCNGQDNVLFTIGAAQIAAHCGYPATVKRTAAARSCIRARGTRRLCAACSRTAAVT
jgi:TRAP-type mannitol/chloroaromatic compound transport system permease large subunit